MKQQYQILTLMLFFVLSSVVAFGQRTISGTVSDSDGQGMPGVNVIVKGTSAGTTSDANGRYTLSSNETGSIILVFSFIGYSTQEVDAGTRTTVDVAMTEDIRELNEVVVTALGIQRETKALQYSVTEVNGENFTKARVNNVGNSLAGRVAGVNVSGIATGPAGSSRIIIRGNKTLSGNNQPLYVIDGIPLDNTMGSQAGTWAGQDQGDGMSSINPNDIESITVLKGASATALYGARGGYGVINIVTKKGTKRQGLGIEVSSNLVFDKVNNLSEVQGKYGTGHYVNGVASKPVSLQEAYNDADDAWGPAFDNTDVLTFDGTVRKYSNAGDNWNRFYDIGKAWTNSFSITGGGDKQTFRFSASDLKSDGVVPQSGFDRTNLALSTNAKVGKKLTVNAKVLYSHEHAKNRPTTSDSPFNAVQAIWHLPPNVNVDNLYGDPNKPGAIPEGIDPAVLLAWGGTQGTQPAPKFAGLEMNPANNGWGPNPWWAAYQHNHSDKRDRINTSADVRYDITSFLYATGRIGMDWYTLRRTDLTAEGTHGDHINFGVPGNATQFALGGTLSETEIRSREINMDWTLGFNKTFSKISVNAFVGGNRMRRSYENISVNGTSASQGFVVPFVPTLSNLRTRSFNYNFNESGINSLYGSAEIGYNNIVFLTATVRKDWFSVLNADAGNSVLYPSVGASFVFSDAFSSLPSWLSFGKVRATWAQVGFANTVNAYDANLTYSLSPTPHLGHQLASISSAQGRYGRIPNPELVPALSTEIEFGFDTRLFNNRIGVDVTYYNQKTTDDILDATISGASGFSRTQVNIGELKNEGIEVLLTGTPIQKAIQWDVSLNMTHNKNTVVSLIEGTTEISGEESRTQTTRIKHIEGRVFGMITGRVQGRSPDGRLIYNAQGQPVRANGGAYAIIGNSNPDLYGGLNNSITYKGINLSFLIDFKFGGEIHSGTNQRLDGWGISERSVQGRDGETPIHITGVLQNGDGSFTDVDRDLTANEARNYWNNLGNEAADNYIYDAGFGKLRQLTLGYSLPRAILSKTPFQNVTISFVGRNLAILWKHVPNIDPESSYSANNNAQGLEYFAMPATRSYGFDLNIKF